MTDITTAISTVNDGSMLDRSDWKSPNIVANRAKFLKNSGVSINDTSLVRVEYEGDDFTRYHEVTESDKGRGMFDSDIEIADSLITRARGHALFLPIADCVGAVFYDPKESVLMLSHLGRHSILQEGGEKSVGHLVSKYRCNPADIQVWLSPAPGEKSYPLFDRDNRSLKAVLHEQLDRAGISPDNIVDNTSDTSEDPTYFSHSEFLKGNREQDGRFAIVAMMR